ncbi:MAG: uroporphyrinogen decarboxylase family protein [Desulfatiglandales bacterium]
MNPSTWGIRCLIRPSAMICPSMFRELVSPLLRRLTGALEVPCCPHICEDTSLIVDAMVETGAAVLSLDQCADSEGFGYS